MSEDKFNLERFVRQQESDYDRAYKGEGAPVALLFEPTGAKRRSNPQRFYVPVLQTGALTNWATRRINLI